MVVSVVAEAAEAAACAENGFVTPGQSGSGSQGGGAPGGSGGAPGGSGGHQGGQGGRTGTSAYRSDYFQMDSNLHLIVEMAVPQ